MVRQHRETKNLDEGSRNGTYNTGSNLTEFGGMGTGTTTATGVCIDTVWERASPHQVGKATQQLDFAILAGPTGTGLEPNLVEKIKPMLDSCTNSKTMGHIMGYVGALEQ